MIPYLCQQQPQREVLGVRRPVLGEEYPDTLPVTSVGDLASSLHVRDSPLRETTPRQ